MAKTKKKPYTWSKPKPKKLYKPPELTFAEAERLWEIDQVKKRKAIAKAKAIQQKYDNRLKLTKRFLLCKFWAEFDIQKFDVEPKLLSKIRTEVRRRKNAEYLRESQEMLANVKNRYASIYSWRAGLPIIEENFRDLEAMRLKDLYWLDKMRSEIIDEVRCWIEWNAKKRFADMKADVRRRRRRDRRRLKVEKRDELYEHVHYIKERIIIHYMTSDLIDDDEEIEFFKQKEYDDNVVKEAIVERIYKRYKKYKKEYKIDYVDYAIALKKDVRINPNMTKNCKRYFRARNGLAKVKKRLNFLNGVDGYKMSFIEEEEEWLNRGVRNRYAAIAKDVAYYDSNYRYLFFELEDLREYVAEHKKDVRRIMVKLERLAKQENLEDKVDPFFKRLGIDITMKFEPHPKWSVYYKPGDTDFTEQDAYKWNLDFQAQDDIEEVRELENFSIRMNQTQLATDRIMESYELLMYDNQQLKLALTNYMGGIEAVNIPRNEFAYSFLERNRKITARRDKSLEAERKRKELAQKIGLTDF